MHRNRTITVSMHISGSSVSVLISHIYYIDSTSGNSKVAIVWNLHVSYKFPSEIWSWKNGFAAAKNSICGGVALK